MDRGPTSGNTNRIELKLEHSLSVYQDDLSLSIINDVIASGELPYVNYRTLHTDIGISDAIPEDWELLYRSFRGKKMETRVYRTPFDELVGIRKAGDAWLVTVAARRQEDASAIVEYLRGKAPPVEIVDNGAVAFYFWTLGEHGASYRRRELDVPTWKNIESNYPDDVQDAVLNCMNIDPRYISGRLLLWHGPPGVGKSYSIRGLAREWLPWCDTHYVVDPEAFFGSANYMLHVLLESDATSSFKPEAAPEGRVALSGEERWKLVIIEDADEFMQADAKRRQGQSLSRLLNLADGLVGQGTRLLLLITTNERLSDIHPAVSRPGRCLANVNFRRFEPEEAALWLKANEVVDHPVREALTLAEMFDVRREVQQIRLKHLATKSGMYL